MSRRRSALLPLTLIAAFIIAARPATAALDPQQFAVGWVLEPGSDASFLGVLLPYDVYRESGGLGELAVLDVNGELMPFYRRQISTAAQETEAVLGASPLFGADPRVSQSELELTAPNERTLRLLRRETLGERVTAYLVDARTVVRAPASIALEWQALDRPFLVTVTIEQSDDLQRWRTVGRGAAAALRIEGEEFRHAEIPLSAESGGYYRIAWQGRLEDWNLERVRLTSRGPGTAPEPERIVLDAVASTKETSRYRLLFDAGAPVPIESADFVFPSDNAWIEASLAYARSPEGPWQRVAPSRLFYALEIEGTALASDPAAIGPIEARYWRASIRDAPPEGLQLRLAMRPDELRIAANGSPPYMLVGGTLADGAGPDPTFAAVFAELDASLPVARVSLAPMQVLGGQAAVTARPEFPWRQAWLWGALLAAVSAVAAMAVKLFRELSSS